MLSDMSQKELHETHEDNVVLETWERNVRAVRRREMMEKFLGKDMTVRLNIPMHRPMRLPTRSS